MTMTTIIVSKASIITPILLLIIIMLTGKMESKGFCHLQPHLQHCNAICFNHAQLPAARSNKLAPYSEVSRFPCESRIRWQDRRRYTHKKEDEEEEQMLVIYDPLTHTDTKMLRNTPVEEKKGEKEKEELEGNRKSSSSSSSSSSCSSSISKSTIPRCLNSRSYFSRRLSTASI